MPNFYYEGWEEYETWVDLSDFPNYQVSNHGRVRNKRNGYILKPIFDRYGYLRLSIGKVDNIPVHRLVCEAFYGPPTLPNAQVNHIDCDRSNNHVFYLEWCPPSRNIKWGVDHGTIDPMIGLRKAVEVNKRPVRIVELDEEFESVKDCADFLGVPLTNACRCLRGSRKGQRLHGYHIEYVD